jgi:hypothetical protein
MKLLVQPRNKTTQNICKVEESTDVKLILISFSDIKSAGLFEFVLPKKKSRQKTVPSNHNIMKNVCESLFVKDDQLNLWADMTKLFQARGKKKGREVGTSTIFTQFDSK